MPSRHNGPRLLFGLCTLACIGGAPALAQVSPQESAKQVQAAPGLKATLWAAEPMVLNPTTIDVDSRGRVWVTEGLNYRLTRGGNKRFSRIEEADAIKILEDTDHDGTADKVTVFADKVFPVPMGIAVEERWSTDGKYQGCRVFVGNSPDLLVLEDTDGDDKADKRYPLLTGFGGIDSDHGVHGMVLGPDGKLYFTHGDGCCSVQQDKSERQQNFDVVDQSGRHVSSDQLANTLRVNRDGTQFEILADRQRNNYETSVNAFGQLFTSDNDDDGNRGCRVIWIMDGGKYGYHTNGSPRHWGEDVPGNVPKLVGTGNGSPAGIMVYEGKLLPADFQNAVFEVDAGTRQVNHFPLTREGAAFRTEPRVLLSSTDPWFRPIDACAAPDGSVFVADWYDAGVGGHAFSDQTTGRIYRVSPENNTPAAVAFHFDSVAGLVEALGSPNVAARDVARRLLIERGPEAVSEAVKVVRAQGQADPLLLARLYWVAADVPALKLRDSLAKSLKDGTWTAENSDPRLRELVVRILGRDVSRVGKVEARGEQPPLAALAYLDSLIIAADDPDAGVRRELILALRDLPTEKVGPTLRKLAAAWDGRDRWYLEALGLALRNREAEFVTSLFDGSLFGPLDASSDAAKPVALPPYFPVDRNEAFLAVGEELPPATALSKTLGLMWELHRVESLPALARLAPQLATPELRQAADDVIAQVEDPRGAVHVAELALATADPTRKSQAIRGLARKLGGPWNSEAGQPRVVELIESALTDPALQQSGVALAGATRDARYFERLERFVEAESVPMALRVAALDALAQARAPQTNDLARKLIATARDARAGSEISESAIRALARLGAGPSDLEALMNESELPLSLRREALRGLSQLNDGGRRLVDLTRESKLPPELKLEAATALRSHRDWRIRDQANKLFPITIAGGKPLPPTNELLERAGSAERGQAVFFRTAAATGAASQSCGSCHRVQGQGQWIGPDLSTIGTKYGKDELLRSVLNPGASVGFSYRATTAATRDGRVITGLPVDDQADRLVLKTADGQRVVLNPSEIEERTVSEISLMPEGLCESMTDQDLVDLLAYLTTLKQPVSIAGVARALGPIDPEKTPSELNGGKPLDPTATLEGQDGKPASWSRITANAEGRIDLSSLAAVEGKSAALVLIPIATGAAQPARLVVESPTRVEAWLNGARIELARPEGAATHSAELALPAGASQLVLRVAGGSNPSVVATVVSGTPVEFESNETGAAGGHGS